MAEDGTHSELQKSDQNDESTGEQDVETREGIEQKKEIEEPQENVTKPQEKSLEAEVLPEKTSVKLSQDPVTNQAADDDQQIGIDAGREEYITPLEDPLRKADQYLAKHMIMTLFYSLTAGIAYNHPEDPLDFMISEIERMQEIDRRKRGVVKKTPSESVKKTNAAQKDISREENVTNNQGNTLS